MIYIVSPWLWWQVLGATLAILRLANRDTRLNIAGPLVVGLTPKYLVFSSWQPEVPPVPCPCHYLIVSIVLARFWQLHSVPRILRALNHALKSQFWLDLNVPRGISKTAMAPLPPEQKMKFFELFLVFFCQLMPLL